MEWVHRVYGGGSIKVFWVVVIGPLCLTAETPMLSANQNDPKA